MEKVAEGLVSNAGTETEEQS